MKAKLSSFFQSIFALFGANEVLFLFGIVALFYGLQGFWSLYGAFIVCGSLLIIVSILGILVAQKKGD
jgi:hypothetical protein